MEDGEQYSRETRIAVQRQAVLVDSAGVTYPATVSDLSSGGFRVECQQLLRVGEYVLLNSGRNHPLRGQIRWADGHTAGGIFLDEVADTVT